MSLGGIVRDRDKRSREGRGTTRIRDGRNHRRGGRGSRR